MDKIGITSIDDNHYIPQWAGLFGGINVLNQRDYPYQFACKILEHYTGEIPNGYWHCEEEKEWMNWRIMMSGYDFFTITGWLKNNYSFPCTVISISEWSVINNMAAQAAIWVKDKLLIHAQAVDYSKNKQSYTALVEKKHELWISAIALRMDKAETATGFSENSCGYIPEDINKPDSPFYQFTGIILNRKSINHLSSGIEGYVFEMRLVSLPADENYFVINMFLNKENLFTENFNNGDRVTGIAMFQVGLR